MMICQYKQCNKDVSTDTVCQCERERLDMVDGQEETAKDVWEEIESLKESIKQEHDINALVFETMQDEIESLETTIETVESTVLDINTLQKQVKALQEPKQSAEDDYHQLRLEHDAMFGKLERIKGKMQHFNDGFCSEDDVIIDIADILDED